MKLKALIDEYEIQGAFELLTESLSSGEHFNRPLNFIGGDSGSDIYWHQEEGVWLSFAYYDNRYLCVCGVDNPKENDRPLEIICAFNPPFEGINRRCAAAFASDSTGIVYLTHSGKFPSISKDSIRRELNHLLWSTITWSGLNETEAIVVCNIDSETLISDLAKFVRAVRLLKSGYRSAAQKRFVLAKPDDGKQPREGYVYLLEYRGDYKIGVSINVEVRRKQIASKLPRDPELIHKIYSKDSYGLEALLHKRFASKRLNGEWFELRPSDVRYIRTL